MTKYIAVILAASVFRISVGFSSVALAATSPFDSTEANRGPAAIAFGLNKLKWGMSVSEARLAYPGFTGTTVRPGTFSYTNLPTLYFDNYKYAGCSFDGVVRFEDNKLKMIGFSTVGPADNLPCDKAMKREFEALYGVPVKYHTRDTSSGHWYPFDGYYGRYDGSQTRANYELTLGSIAFGFSDAAAPAKNFQIFDVQGSAPPEK